MISCQDILVFIDESPPSKRILNYLQKAGCNDFVVKNYKEHIEDILMLEAGSSLVPLVWNKKNNKIIVGCPLEYEDFLAKLKDLIS